MNKLILFPLMALAEATEEFNIEEDFDIIISAGRLNIYNALTEQEYTDYGSRTASYGH